MGSLPKFRFDSLSTDGSLYFYRLDSVKNRMLNVKLICVTIFILSIPVSVFVLNDVSCIHMLCSLCLYFFQLTLYF
ncbi:hypothetical protein HanRHA438_Chr07g0306161 [Helianthus annuus]|nr:hypothetical protein HanRHA438_Chr07g0306161 [Helianthus annuus]